MNLSKPNHFVVFVFILIFFSCIKESNYIVVTDKDVFVSSKEISDSEFLGDGQCKECHQAEFKDWKGSHHDKAMQVADSLSVLGDFNNAVFTSQGVTSKFFKKDNSFFFNTGGPDGGYQEYEIVYTFGM